MDRAVYPRRHGTGFLCHAKRCPHDIELALSRPPEPALPGGRGCERRWKSRRQRPGLDPRVDLHAWRAATPTQRMRHITHCRRYRTGLRKKRLPMTAGNEGDSSGGKPRYSDKKKPWCRDCSAHRKISVKEGQKGCSHCGMKDIFIPQNQFIFELVFFLAAGFFGFLSKEGMESGEGWAILLVIPGIFFTVLGVRCQRNYGAWSHWSKAEPGSAETGRKRKKRRSFKPPTRKPSSPPPAPPPLPPDANSE